MPLLLSLANYYKALLALPKPWILEDIRRDEDELRVDITLVWPAGRMVRFPICEKRCSIKDHAQERIRRHLDVMQFKTNGHCRVLHSRCPIHDATIIMVPWAEPKTHWTAHFEACALTIIGHTATITKPRVLPGLNLQQAHTTKKRVVERGLMRRDLEEIEHLGIDEKSFVGEERLITVWSDLDDERVLEVASSKSNDAAREVIGVLSDVQRASVTAVAMDVSAEYEAVSREFCPPSERVFDAFHGMQTITRGIHIVRRKEHAALTKKGVHSFPRTRYLWLTRRENWSRRQKDQFRRVEAFFGTGKLRQARIGRAGSLKEAFHAFCKFLYGGATRRFFRQRYFWATHSRLVPMIETVKTLERHPDGVPAYVRHGITNAFVEGMNSKIQDIKYAARGFRNFGNYRIAILFACGKTDVKP